MDKEVTLKSGKKLTMQYAQFEVQMDLLSALVEEATKLNLNIIDKDALSLGLTKLIAIAMTAKGIDSIFWRCANTCLYDENRITQQTFNEVENRKDFLEVKYWVLFFNLEIFFSSQFGELSALKNLRDEEAIANLMQSLVSK